MTVSILLMVFSIIGSYDKMGFKFAIDRGGTFTDVYVEYPDKSQFVYKLLSEDYHYKDAPSEAIRRLISKV